MAEPIALAIDAEQPLQNFVQIAFSSMNLLRGYPGCSYVLPDAAERSAWVGGGSMKSVRIAVIVTGVVAGFLPATSALATSYPTLRLTVPTVSITSTTGKLLQLSVEASKDYTGAVDTQVTVAHSSTAVQESHIYSFAYMKSSTLTWSTTSNTGALATGSALSPYGSVTIHLSKYASSKRTCQNVSGQSTTVTRYTVNLSAAIDFNIRDLSTSTTWGSLKPASSPSPKSPFAGKRGVLTKTTNGDCQPPPPPSTFPCASEVLWNAPTQPVANHGFAILRGFTQTISGTTVNQIQAQRNLVINSAYTWNRSDVISTRQPAPVFSAGPPASASATTSGNDASGSGTSTSNGTGPNKIPAYACSANGSTSHSQNESIYPATWANGSSAISVGSAVGGAIKSAASGSSEIITASWS